MENTNKIKRSKLWQMLYDIIFEVAQNYGQTAVGDGLDVPSAATEIEKLINSREPYVFSEGYLYQGTDTICKLYGTQAEKTATGILIAQLLNSHKL